MCWELLNKIACILTLQDFGGVPSSTLRDIKFYLFDFGLVIHNFEECAYFISENKCSNRAFRDSQNSARTIEASRFDRKIAHFGWKHATRAADADYESSPPRCFTCDYLDACAPLAGRCTCTHFVVAPATRASVRITITEETRERENSSWKCPVSGVWERRIPWQTEIDITAHFIRYDNGNSAIVNVIRAQRDEPAFPDSSKDIPSFHFHFRHIVLPT